MIDQAIVLVGGRGTRLKSVVHDLPKPMANINGKPFLHYLLTKITNEGIVKIVLAVGYKHEIIQEYFGDEFQGAQIIYSIEKCPLGTGGAMKKAFQHLKGPAFVFNGDALFNIPFKDLLKKFNEYKTDIVIALKSDKKFDRYGNVEVNENGQIVEFQEKGYVEEGTFNGGVYIIHPRIWDVMELEDKFSFETDVMEAYVSQLQFYSVSFNSYFIDIGVPEDYERAQIDLSFLDIDLTWTIFLDRDGVINKLRHNDYVKRVSQFKFIEGSKQAIVKLSNLFFHVLVVTNQQGIGKGFMTEKDLKSIHDHLSFEIEEAGGHISKIYHCPELEENSPKCRKPNTGMGLQAKGRLS